MTSQPLAGRVLSLLPSLANFIRAGVFGGRLPRVGPVPIRWSVGAVDGARWSDHTHNGSRSFAADAAAESSQGDGISLTDNAVERMRELMAESNDPLVLRIAVEGGGCSGFQYEFKLDNEVKEGDRVFERGGVRLVVDDISLDFLRGAVVDFESNLMRSAFHVVGNPNASSSCGCGSSFAAK